MKLENIDYKNDNFRYIHLYSIIVEAAILIINEIVNTILIILMNLQVDGLLDWKNDKNPVRL